jgi:hypothetical protein
VISCCRPRIDDTIFTITTLISNWKPSSTIKQEGKGLYSKKVSGVLPLTQTLGCSGATILKLLIGGRDKLVVGEGEEEEGL